MRRQARKSFNRLNKFNEFANEYPRLYGEPEADGGHYYPLMWLYPTGMYPTIQWRWDPYAHSGELSLRAKVEANVN